MPTDPPRLAGWTALASKNYIKLEIVDGSWLAVDTTFRPEPPPAPELAPGAPDDEEMQAAWEAWSQSSDHAAELRAALQSAIQAGDDSEITRLKQDAGAVLAEHRTFKARPRSRIAGSAAIAATLLLLSGCGGSSSSSSSPSAPASSSSTSQPTQTTQSAGQFNVAIAAVLNQFKAASQGTGAELEHASSQTDAQVAATFQQLAARWRAALTKLETLQPPPQLTAAYSRLKSQVGKVDTDLATIASAAQSHDATAAKAATTKLISDILRAKATSTTLSNGTP